MVDSVTRTCSAILIVGTAVVMAEGAVACGARTGLDALLGDSIADSGLDQGSTADAPTSSRDSGVGPMPRCAPGGPGLTDCGSLRENCCTSLSVTSGSFFRTYTNSGSGPTDEADPAMVSAFQLDKYVVTVGRFRQFVSAWRGGWTPPAGAGKHLHLNGGRGLANSGTPGSYETGWSDSDDRDVDVTDTALACGADPLQPSTWTPSASTNERLPINCASWATSYAFCIWDGGFLPSETEWEYAAAGGMQQREYPWGNSSPGTASAYAIYGCYYPDGMSLCVGLTTVAPVGTPTLGAGLWGHLDLGGEMFEWTLDDFADYVNPCTDCVYLRPTTTGHVNRGGDFFDDADPLHPANREWGMGPTAISGIRCARSPW